MRIWTLHPMYLDTRGLVALWRETLLAQKVLQGGTRGYRSHPQLVRFRSAPDPMGSVGAYLQEVHAEGLRRGYRFDHEKIALVPLSRPRLEATEGQLEYEWRHLLEKLARRDPATFAAHGSVVTPLAHPLFEVVPGPTASWERLVGGD